MKKEAEKDMRKGVSENTNKAMDGSRHKVEEVSTGAKDLAKGKNKDIQGDLSKSLDKDMVIAKEKRR